MTTSSNGTKTPLTTASATRPATTTGGTPTVTTTPTTPRASRREIETAVERSGPRSLPDTFLD